MCRMDVKIVSSTLLFLSVIGSVFSYGNCPICGSSNTTLLEKLGRVEMLSIRWLRDQQNIDGSWPNVNTQNAILGLQLANQSFLANQDFQQTLLTTSRLEYEVMSQILPSLSRGCGRGYRSPGRGTCSVRNFDRGAGILGQYMLALQSACYQTDNFYGVDLNCLMISLLKDFPEPNFNNFFQYSLAILPLCSSNTTIFRKALLKLAEGSDPTDYCHTQFGVKVDTLSLQVMAMVCASDQAINKNVPNWNDILDARVQCILNLQNDDRSFGNAISTALATQALFAASVDPNTWFCEETVSGLLDVGEAGNGDFGGVGATAQIIPFLGCNNFGSLEPVGENCSVSFTLPTFTTPTPPVFGPLVTFYIEVIENDNEESYQVTIPEGENLFFGMQVLASLDDGFRFETSDSAFGQSIDSINDVASDAQLNLFWTIHIDIEGNFAAAGIEGLYPRDGETYIFILTDFS